MNNTEQVSATGQENVQTNNQTEQSINQTSSKSNLVTYNYE